MRISEGGVADGALLRIFGAQEPCIVAMIADIASERAFWHGSERLDIQARPGTAHLGCEFGKMDICEWME
jgi:hypothetical protein